ILAGDRAALSRPLVLLVVVVPPALPRSVVVLVVGRDTPLARPVVFVVILVAAERALLAALLQPGLLGRLLPPDEQGQPKCPEPEHDSRDPTINHEGRQCFAGRLPTLLEVNAGREVRLRVRLPEVALDAAARRLDLVDHQAGELRARRPLIGPFRAVPPVAI